MPNQFEEFLESTGQNQQGTPGSNGETAKQYTNKQKNKGKHIVDYISLN